MNSSDTHVVLAECIAAPVNNVKTDDATFLRLYRTETFAGLTPPRTGVTYDSRIGENRTTGRPLSSYEMSVTLFDTIHVKCL